MRILMYMCLCLIVLCCEDKQSKTKINYKQQDSLQLETSNASKKKSPSKPRKYPRLTDDNAMDFFLEYEKNNPEDKVRLTTDFGTIDILLFDKTKFHRANFIFLTKQGYFNNTQFYRIVNNFIIQGGNSDEMSIAKKRQKIGKYLLPTDTNRGYVHDRGVISMPSSDIENPYKLASPFEFFIVQGKNGAHHLDGNYTIFGKVINGMDVVDTIAAQETDGAEWPLHNVYIHKAEIIN